MGLRFKYIRQRERADCGYACIQMIARHFGKKLNISYLTKFAEPSKLGITLDDIRVILSKIHIDSEPLRLEISDLWNIPCPVILHWDQNHFVVLYNVNSKNKIFYIADPNEGKIKLTESDFSEHWCSGDGKGIALLVNPTTNFYSISDSKENSNTPFIKYIINLIINKKRNFAVIMLCTLLCMGADMLLPLLTQTTVDKGILNKDVHLIILIAVYQAIVLIGSLVSSKSLQYFNSKLGLLLNKELTIQYFAKLLSLPLIFFDKKAPADLIQKLDDQLRLKNYVMQLPTNLILYSLNIVVFSGLLLYYNWLLCIIFFSFILLQFIWNLSFLKKRKDLDYIYYRQSAKIQNLTYESINGIQDIKIAQATDCTIQNWEGLQDRYLKLGVKTTLFDIIVSSGATFIDGLRAAIMTAVCAILVIGNRLSIGEMMAAGYVIGRLTSPFLGLLSLINETQNAKISLERLSEVLNINAGNENDRPLTKSNILLKNVFFKYAGNSSPYVIVDLSLNIKNGDTIAIVGKSGCGKTTLLRLLMGLYKPQSGKIYLGAVDVDEIDQNSWLSRCGVVMQNGYIFSETLLYNITFCNKIENYDLVMQILDIVGLTEFVHKMPAGLSTIIGPSGLELSGGQKQRILIARALYRMPEILILDEPTSSLDAANEAKITSEIFKFQKNKTTIIAAHRLSTIRKADTILFMENGQIIEQGTHEELIRLRGRYFDLVKSQL